MYYYPDAIDADTEVDMLLANGSAVTLKPIISPLHMFSLGKGQCH